MIRYTSSFISNYYESLENKTLDPLLLECLNSILNTINNDISLNSIDNDSDFRFKKTKIKSKSSDNYFQHQHQQSYTRNNHTTNTNTNNTSLKRKEETRTKIEQFKSTIKSILNKLSPNNYIKLEQELITMYTQLHTNCIENNTNEDIYNKSNLYSKYSKYIYGIMILLLILLIINYIYFLWKCKRC
jgi:hypothetical protein